jgi:hypothetical protein
MSLSVVRRPLFGRRILLALILSTFAFVASGRRAPELFGGAGKKTRTLRAWKAARLALDGQPITTTDSGQPTTDNARRQPAGSLDDPNL